MSAYDFLKGLGEKIPQKVLRQEYIRRRNAIVRRIKRAEKIAEQQNKDINIKIDIPKVPKRVTEGSFKKLERAEYQWTWQNESGDVADLYKFTRRKRASQKAAAALDAEFKRLHQQVYSTTTAVSPENIPSVEDKWIATLEHIIVSAISETDDPHGQQDNFYRVVNHRAKIALDMFVAIGINNEKERRQLNYNLEQLSNDQFAKLQDDLQDWIWYYKPTMTYEPEMQDLLLIIKIVSGNASESEKRLLADLSADEGFTNMD